MGNEDPELRGGLILRNIKKHHKKVGLKGNFIFRTGGGTKLKSPEGHK